MHQQTCIKMFIATSLIIVPNWKQHKGQWKIENKNQINKSWYIYIKKCYSVMNDIKRMSCTTWMNATEITLSEINKTQ